MSNRYVNVVITRETQAISQAGFGLSLILSTEKTAAYKEYTEISEIGTDFGADSNTYKLATKLLGQNPRPEKVAIYGVIYDPATQEPTTLIEALNTLLGTHGDFYYVHCTDQSDEVITAIAEWIAPQKRFYYATTSNKTLHSTIKRENTVLLVTETPDEYTAAGWVGVCSPQPIGSLTWTFKTINGATADNYSESDLATIEQGASAYIRQGGVDLTSKGVATNGEYIDVVQAQHFLVARITEAVFGLLKRKPKVPFTSGGISMVVDELDGVLASNVEDAEGNGIIARDGDGVPLYSITIPDINDISTNDKAARILPDIPFSATISGAIEKVNFRGVLQL